MKRKCFYSFHYKPDVTRVAKLRNIGAIEGNRPATDNGWESVKKGGDAAIKRWIAKEMKGKSCTIVMVGTNTASRTWINHEIIESWNSGMGVVGINIHGISDIRGNLASMGSNPFDFINYGNYRKLSSVAKCYNPSGRTSKDRYAWISKNLAAMVEEAIKIRNRN